ncbi:protein of unknown function [Agreia sp. COWG]|nr:protein of unknown function [Agreia sp. COWG]
MRAIFHGRRPRQQLVEVLGMIAGYNDKGADWSGHGAAQVEHFRHRTHADILRLVTGIGEHNFSPPLLEALTSGQAVEDSSGRFKAMAQDELL